MTPSHLRRLSSEAIGSFFLFATVIGSGIMAERLAGGNVAVALLGNTLATGAMLFVLITMLGPLSGAHFNPAVSLVAWLRRDLSAPLLGGYVLVQLVGGCVGVWTAHVMFDLPILQASTKVRTGLGQWTAEATATFGLVLLILIGAVLLILGVFAMLYIRERRLWIWLSPAGDGRTRVLMAMSTPRRTLDIDADFNALRQDLLGPSALSGDTTP